MKRHIAIVAILAVMMIPLGRNAALADTDSQGSQPSSPGTPVQSLWTRTSQTFETDGLFSTHVYPYSVDYQDASGTWQAIDDSLVASPVQGYAYQNKANRYTVSLPDDLGGSVPARIETAAGWITFSLNGMHTTGSSVSGNTDTYTFNGGTISLASLNDELKESITLSGPSSPSTFSFTINTSSGISLKPAGGNTINVVDASGKTQFSFARPFMQDAAGATSTGISVSTTRTQSGITLTATADRTWLSDPARQWPVVIDPTVTLPSATQDCYLSSNATTGKYCPFHYDYVGWNGAATYRTMMRFDLSSIPTDAQVQSADLAVDSIGGQFVGTAISVGLYQVTKPWTTSINWNTYDGTNAWSTPGGDVEPTPAYVLSNMSLTQGWQHWYPTQLVQGWVNGSITNDGLLLKSQSETTKQLALSQATMQGPAYAPTLTVTYTPSTGDASRFTFSHPALNDQPDISVNVATGDLLAHQIGPYEPDDMFPVDLYYNSAALASGPVGNRWLMALGTYTSLDVLSNGNVTTCGPEGFSAPFTKNSDGTFTPASGVTATLTENLDGSYTLTDNSSGDVYIFTAAGLLTTQSDSSGDSSTYMYDSSGRLSTITNENSITTTFSYGSPVSSTLVTTIAAPNGVTATLGYDGAGDLTSYTDDATGTTGYGYNTSGNLTSVTLPSAALVTIAYDSQGRASSVVGIPGQDSGNDSPTTTYVYNPGVTTATDQYGGVTTYTYSLATDQVLGTTDPRTGYLQVKAIDTSTGDVVQGASVTVTSVDGGGNTSTTSVTTDDTGLSPLSGFPTPLAPNDSSATSRYWSTASVTVSAPNYATYTEDEVKVIDGTTQVVTATLVPGSGSYSVASDGTVTDNTSNPGADQLLTPNPTLQTYSVGVYREPSSIVVHLCLGDQSCGNKTFSFESYLTHVLPSEWQGSWGLDAMASLYFGARAIRTFAGNEKDILCKYRCQTPSKPFDITDTQADQVINSYYMTHTDPHTDQAVNATAYDMYTTTPLNRIPILAHYAALTGCFGNPYTGTVLVHDSPVQCGGAVPGGRLLAACNIYGGGTRYPNLGTIAGAYGASQCGSYWWARDFSKTSTWLAQHYYGTNVWTVNER